MSVLNFRRDGGNRMVVSGPMTYASVDAHALEASRACLAPTPGALTEVDLAAVSAGDSAGLALLIDWAGWVRRQGGRIRFLNPPQSLLGIAALSDVSEILGLESGPQA